MRESGILFPVFSLPSRFGVGCFSREAYEFIDFLKQSGQGYWQILPIGPTGYGDSPYQPLSAFAGNPYFISPESLIEDGLLTWDECSSMDFGSNVERVDYGKLFEKRKILLGKAFKRFIEGGGEKSSEYSDFTARESYWLDDYCLYMALKDHNDGQGQTQWDDGCRLRKESALKKARTELSEAIAFYSFCQYKFDEQWQKLRAYASEQKIKIIGDIPFYVSMDSADVWAHPEAFLMDKDLVPTVVAGCPPDAFSSTGQLWGNPIYDWSALKKSGYDWWIKRMKRSYELYDVVRIDHFHGFSDYYAVPYGEETAQNGKNCKGPGYDFFKVLEKETGAFYSENGMRIIAEDLGTVTAENQKLLADTGIPGMKILQYAFTSWDSIYMPYRHIANCVVYTGTHDNMTCRTWLDAINDGERDFLRRYLNSMNSDYGALVWDMIRECYRSVADLCIVPLQDYLVLGNEGRINTPGAFGENWQWRLRPGFLSQDLSRSIRLLCETYGRLPR